MFHLTHNSWPSTVFKTQLSSYVSLFLLWEGCLWLRARSESSVSWSPTHLRFAKLNGMDRSFFWGGLFFFFKDIIFKETGREGEREGEKHRCTQEKHLSVATHMPPTKDLAFKPGVCPNQESNRWPFSLRNDTHPTEPHQSGLKWTAFEEESQVPRPGLWKDSDSMWVRVAFLPYLPSLCTHSQHFIQARLLAL